VSALLVVRARVVLGLLAGAGALILQLWHLVAHALGLPCW
jgi:hypothetical protein